MDARSIFFPSSDELVDDTLAQNMKATDWAAREAVVPLLSDSLKSC